MSRYQTRRSLSGKLIRQTSSTHVTVVVRDDAALIRHSDENIPRLGRRAIGAGGNALCGHTAYANHATSYKASQVAQSGRRMTGKLYVPVGELVKKSEINCKTTRTVSCANKQVLGISNEAYCR